MKVYRQRTAYALEIKDAVDLDKPMSSSTVTSKENTH